MSAPVRVESEVWGDPRYELLGQLAGFNRYEAIGRMTMLWSVCTDKHTDTVSESIIRACIGSVEWLIEAELGERVEGGIRVRGCAGRIEWKAEFAGSKVRAGKARAAASSRDQHGRMLAAAGPAQHQQEPAGASRHPADIQQTSSRHPADIQQTTSTGPAQSSALTLTLTPSLTTLREEEDAPLALPSPPVRPKRTRKAGEEPTPAEAASVALVLERLGQWNDVQYTSSEAHTRLIVRHLRRGVTEMDLRMVVRFCGEQWVDDPKMRPYLRPETLFGVESIAKYLDPARTKYRGELERQEREASKPSAIASVLGQRNPRTEPALTSNEPEPTWWGNSGEA